MLFSDFSHSVHTVYIQYAYVPFLLQTPAEISYAACDLYCIDISVYTYLVRKYMTYVDMRSPTTIVILRRSATRCTFQ
jgi:hypothetical protein